MQTRAPDPVGLAVELIRRPSVTPADAGALDVLERALREIGFSCRRMPFGDIDNLWAQIGEGRPHLCFAGHTDVVPPGDLDAWRHPPFAGWIEDGVLHGRGAADMKGAIGAFVSAASRASAAGQVRGTLSLMITGDEEGLGVHGTQAMLRQLAAEGVEIDHCIVGEPTSTHAAGDTIKIGRRGSLNAEVTIEGVQGHVAYPERAANPIPALVRLLSVLTEHRLDEGFTGFQPSNLEITSIDVGNAATNVIPARATARLNIRFNPAHTGASLSAWICGEADKAVEGRGVRAGVDIAVSGEAFLTEPGPFVDLVARAAQAATGRAPQTSTTGGTSDARFIRAHCPVVELGLRGETMHRIDEQVEVAEIQSLAAIYERLIGDYFAAPPAG